MKNNSPMIIEFSREEELRSILEIIQKECKEVIYDFDTSDNRKRFYYNIKEFLVDELRRAGLSIEYQGCPYYRIIVDKEFLYMIPEHPFGFLLLIPFITHKSINGVYGIYVNDKILGRKVHILNVYYEEKTEVGTLGYDCNITLILDECKNYINYEGVSIDLTINSDITEF